MHAQPSIVTIRAKELVLFDLDGVLWDSRENMARSWAEVQAKLGVAVSFDAYFREIGKPFGMIMKRLGLDERAEEIEAMFRMASMANINFAKFYDGAAQVLESLKSAGAKLGIVTSKDGLRTSAILAMLPVTFDVIRTPDGKMRGKPAPDHLLAAMAEAGVDPVDTVYVGDMDTDYEAAKRANIDYVHVTWGYGKTPRGCHFIMDKTSDLAGLSSRRSKVDEVSP